MENHFLIFLYVQTQWKITYYYFCMSKHNGKSRVYILDVQTQWKVTYYYFCMSKHNGKSLINIFISPNEMERHLLIFL